MITVNLPALELSPVHIARALVEGNSYDQAAVFNEMARLASLWERPWCFQAAYIAAELSDEARELIAVLAEHVKPQESRS